MAGSSSTRDLLIRICTGREPFSLLLIHESIECRGEHLLKCFVDQYRKTGTSFKLLLLQTDPRRFNADSDSCILPLFKPPSAVITTLQESLDSCSKNSILILDSLNPILISEESSQILKFIQNLKDQFQSVICPFSGELMGQMLLSSLKRLSSTYILLIKRSPYKCVLVTHKKRHRKMGFSSETVESYYEITTDGQIKSCKIQDVKENSVSEKLPEATFNLNLNQVEQKSKSDLILPYVKT